jgi:hypothetical protein
MEIEKAVLLRHTHHSQSEDIIGSVSMAVYESLSFCKA